MGKLFYAILVGLIGAAIVHIAVLFLIPYYTPRDAWNLLAEAGDLNEPITVSGEGPGVVPLLRTGDPLFRAIACRFDLAESGLRLSSTQTVPFWTLSIHDRAGQTTYSLSDRAATDAALDVAVVSPLQMAAMRRGMPAELERALFVESTTTRGIVMVRVLLPDQSWSEVADRFVRDLSCEPLDT